MTTKLTIMTTNLTDKQLKILSSFLDDELGQVPPEEIEKVILDKIAQKAYKKICLEYNLSNQLKDFDQDKKNFYFAVKESGFEFILEWNNKLYKTVYNPGISYENIADFVSYYGVSIYN
jgi:hypothetical protein